MIYISTAILLEPWHMRGRSAPFHICELALIALSFLLAALSHEFVEKPFLNFKTKFEGTTSRRSPETLRILMSGSADGVTSVHAGDANLTSD
jgi:peptidoglycan/LPS O-acetylase OafA/YrhL